MFSKKTLLSVLIVGVIATVAGAGTWAAFSDTETSSGNTFTAGTLDLKLNGLDGITGFSIANVAPKDQGTAGTVTVKNDGTIPGDLVVSSANIVEDENGMNDAETADDTTPGVGDLGNAITISIYDGSTLLYRGSVAGLSGANLGSLAGAEEKTLTIDYEVSDAGNEIQSDILAFDLVFTLNQQ
ncbi:TasA family protein [Methanosarcina sp.]|uniref:TasA family protein n=1 Tax=Methanosarcina sp. TaxID=2213 RepID=UPI0029887B1D|nr:TasA family protein [Methanosarcina sp.]MDW5549314.1 TasA family protein [Methanosarcina sp.]MDW5553495.1 TasA family protein [Methanosarcina sp.]MDW5559820.1 TasA family protein [Methanosarcina sp.]